jgi:hypothetical protein
MQYWNGNHDQQLLKVYLHSYRPDVIPEGYYICPNLPKWLSELVYDSSSTIQIVNTVRFHPNPTSRVKNIFLASELSPECAASVRPVPDLRHENQ